MSQQSSDGWRGQDSPRPSNPDAIRVPPHNDEAERSTLGAALIDNRVMDDLMSQLQPESFYRESHRHIWRAMGALHMRGDAIDVITLADQLNAEGLLDAVGGPNVLARLSSEVPSAANVNFYAQIVKRKSALRSFIATAHALIDECYEDVADFDAFMDTAERQLFAITQSGTPRGYQSMREIIKEAFAQIEALYQKAEQVTGVPSGFADLDEITAGWQKSDLVIIAARPAMGKCLTADAELVLSDGSIQTIEQIVKRGDATLLTLDDSLRLGWTQPSAFVDDGIKPVWRVTTQSGRQITATASHPLLTMQGWTPLHKLEPGDHIAAPARLPNPGARHLSESAQLAAICAAVGRGEPLPPLLFKLDDQSLLSAVSMLHEQRGDEDGQHKIYLLNNESQASQLRHLLLRLGVNSSVQGPVVYAHKVDSATQGDVFWDAIKSIEYVGERQVYDLTIPDTHNFVANDLCVHNTSFCLNMASHAAIERNIPVAFFSLEMANVQLAIRMLCCEGRIDQSKLRTGRMSEQEWARLIKAAGSLSEAKIFLDDTPALPIMEFRSKARKLKSEQDIGMIIIDYLQLMKAPGKNVGSREQEIGEISRNLKGIAKELSIPILALAQLNRGVEQRADKRPMNSDLRESGSIEQDADIIGFIYRDEVYNPDSEDKGIAEFILGKHRNGSLGTVRLRFFGEYTRFENLAPDME
jgi:replicative DNA helicase